MLGGYMGRILEVDLSKGRISEKELPPEKTLRKYLGCFGLGLHWLYHRCPPGTSALDSENPLIF